MYNSPEQKLYSSTQNAPIEIEDYEQTNPNTNDRFIQDLSDKISKIMFPLYDGFKSQAENGKIMGMYPVLKFPTAGEVRNNQKLNKPTHEYDLTLTQKQANFRQLANRVQEKQRLENQSISESKIHRLLDQNQARQGYDEEMQSNEQEFGGRNPQAKKYQKARKYYEKLSKQLKSNKKMKRRFKDKNRPKKAKSAYNLFVQQVVPQIKAQNPSFSAPDLVRVAAKMYNQLTEQEKKPYQKRYLIDKERFERERQAYFRQHPEMDYRMDAKQKASFMSGKYMNL